jgi:hypothetical protein
MFQHKINKNFHNKEIKDFFPKFLRLAGYSSQSLLGQKLKLGCSA